MFLFRTKRFSAFLEYILDLLPLYFMSDPTIFRIVFCRSPIIPFFVDGYVTARKCYGTRRISYTSYFARLKYIDPSVVARINMRVLLKKKSIFLFRNFIHGSGFVYFDMTLHLAVK